MVVLVTGAAVVGIGTRNTKGVGYPVSLLKVALRLLETGVSVTNAKEVLVRVKPVTIEVKCGP